jgi:hypothetical protein
VALCLHPNGFALTAPQEIKTEIAAPLDVEDIGIGNLPVGKNLAFRDIAGRLSQLSFVKQSIQNHYSETVLPGIHCRGAWVRAWRYGEIEISGQRIFREDHFGIDDQIMRGRKAIVLDKRLRPQI